MFELQIGLNLSHMACKTVNLELLGLVALSQTDLNMLDLLVFLFRFYFDQFVCFKAHNFNSLIFFNKGLFEHFYLTMGLVLKV